MRLWPMLFIAVIIHLLTPLPNRVNAISNLIFTNNWIHFDQQYLPWTWSLAVDFQLHILVSFLLLFLSSNQWWKWMLVLATISMFYSIIFVYNLVYSSSLRFPLFILGTDYFEADPNAPWRVYYDSVYMSLISRSFPFFLGLFAHSLENKLNRIPSFPLISISSVSFWFSLNWNYSSDKNFIPWTPFFTFLYASSFRIFFSLGVFSFYLLCKKWEKNSPFQLILNLPCWSIIADISYSGFLFHPLVAGAFHSCLKLIFGVIDHSFSLLVLCYVTILFVLPASYGLFQYIEIPLNQLMKQKNVSGQNKVK
jgi:peptidoglycan/LPS O-acetylase OafA/YrhL